MTAKERRGQRERLSALERLSSRYHGRADGSRWARRQGGATAEAGVPLWTAYIGMLQRRAARSSHLLVRRLRQHNARELRLLTGAALRVIQEYERHGEPRLATSGRFIEAVTAWKGEYARHRRLAEASAQHYNQLINFYWIHFLRAAGISPAFSSRTGPRPEATDVDPIWSKQDPFALLSDLDAGDVAEAGATGAEWIIRRALEIVEGRAV
ncbi:hypothetical protein CS0771_03370 [Catellatospora sp. IY07-71]|uniref:hypothetical protein n=1 Tax=Catellatospora sp. IY07-71 TaxID=2728827 RepID=UPI001BB3DEEF|nr:hypothetical protein [Catellatospora sp. IY07-71]BCJ70793.1 hypothetical protein CS0771_03370 [Catellatospora sp. IY07-71]